MSRYTAELSNDRFAVYGYDRMLPEPVFFLQIWDRKIDSKPKEGPAGQCVADYGLIEGLNMHQMMQHISENITEEEIEANPRLKEHIKQIHFGAII